MPSSSKKQHNFMAAIAHNPAFAKKVGVPQSVGKDFSNADKGKTFKKGGDTMASKMDPKMTAMMMARKKTRPDMGAASSMGSVPTANPTSPMGMKKGGKTKKMAKGGGIESKGKTKGKMIKMNMGGKAC